MSNKNSLNRLLESMNRLVHFTGDDSAHHREAIFYILYTGKDEASGKDIWAYLAIPESNVKPFKAQLKDQQTCFSLESYGTILARGDGAQPPADVMQQMEKEYHMNHDFFGTLKQVFTELGKLMPDFYMHQSASAHKNTDDTNDTATSTTSDDNSTA